MPPLEMSATATPEALASPARTCELLGGISLSTLDRLVERGVLEPVRLTPKAHRRFRVTDIETLVAAEEED